MGFWYEVEGLGGLKDGVVITTMDNAGKTYSNLNEISTFFRRQDVVNHKPIQVMGQTSSKSGINRWVLEL